MQDTTETLLRETVEGLHGLRRDLAVLVERMSNDKDARELFTVQYERRHADLQQRQAETNARLESADRERETLRVNTSEMQIQLTNVEKRVNEINASVRWVVYLIVGAIIMAIMAGVIGGALGHVQVR